MYLVVYSCYLMLERTFYCVRFMMVVFYTKINKNIDFMMKKTYINV